jgi:hypothetical protein
LCVIAAIVVLVALQVLAFAEPRCPAPSRSSKLLSSRGTASCVAH